MKRKAILDDRLVPAPTLLHLILLVTLCSDIEHRRPVSARSPRYMLIPTPERLHPQTPSAAAAPATRGPAHLLPLPPLLLQPKPERARRSSARKHRDLPLSVGCEVLAVLASPAETIPPVGEAVRVVVEVELAEAEAFEEGEGDDGVEGAEEEVDGEL